MNREPPTFQREDWYIAAFIVLVISLSLFAFAGA